MKILLVHKSVVESHEYMRAAVERCVAFNNAYEGKANGEILALELTGSFYADAPQNLLYIGIDENAKICASGFATLANYFGTRVVDCDQLWRDSKAAKFEPGQLEQVLKSITKWGQLHGAKVMRTYAINEKVAEVAEGYGWKRSPQILLEMDISSEE